MRTWTEYWRSERGYCFVMYYSGCDLTFCGWMVPGTYPTEVDP